MWPLAEERPLGLAKVQKSRLSLVVVMVTMVTMMVGRLRESGRRRQQNERQNQELFHGVIVARSGRGGVCKSAKMYQECICQRAGFAALVYLRCANA
jgi:hypothetical protein